LASSLSCTACAQSENNQQDVSVEPVTETVQVKVEPVIVPPKPEPTDFACEGVFKQGGAIRCQTEPGTLVSIEGINTKADVDGVVVIGLDRDAPAKAVINTKSAASGANKYEFDIAPREYDVQRIDGLPPSQVSTFTDKQLAHIKASSARKKVGFSSRSRDMGFRDGFTMAVTGTKSSDFGNQRILNGEAKRPHYGVDIAAPTGTPIYAPADGVISLADNDLYFEGAMVLVDHGQGLISMYLHMSEIDVEVGQKVKRGDLLGAVGAKGRATGSHLCWRLKWRNRNLDPELLTQWPHDD
jgi:murein DD-endopeptidase MepM/ murein hydrolase activator NlpD